MNVQRQRRVAFGLAVSAGLLLVLLTLIVTSGQSSALDHKLLGALADLRGPGADMLFQWTSRLGSFHLLGPAVLLAVIGLIVGGRKAQAVALGAAFYGAALATFLLKPVIGRERPVPVDSALQILPTDLSFPSSHATQATALALIAWWLLRHLRWHWLMGMVLIGLAGLVALSRLYLQAHWPSDVIAGALMGLFWVSAVAAVMRGRLTNDQESR